MIILKNALLCIVLVASFAILVSPFAMADDAAVWTTKEPIFTQDDNGTICDEATVSAYDAYADWVMEPHSIKMCITHGLTFDIGTTNGTWQGGGDTYVRFHNSDRFAAIYNSPTLKVIPGTDKVIFMGQYNGNTGLVMNDDIRDIINPDIYTDDGHVFMYYVNELIDSRPLMPLNLEVSEDETQEPIDLPSNNFKPSSFVVSGNGKYIAAYVNDSVVVKYNIATNEAIGVFKVGSYGALANRLHAVKAVSDDGRFILLGTNGVIIDTAGCGDVDFESANANTVIENPCPSIDIQDELRIPFFGQYDTYDGLEAGFFSNDGNTIKLLISGRVLQPNGFSQQRVAHRFILQTNDSYFSEPGHSIKYLALGDSYSSGEGDVPNAGVTRYLSGTEGRDQCHISIRSYPYELALRWGYNQNQMKSVACSGAHIDSDYYGSGLYVGQHKELLNMSGVDKENYASNSLNNFIPGVVRQIDFVAEYKPEIVTFTGGGNDIGFGDIIHYCVTSRCSYATDEQLRKNLERTIYDQRENVGKFVKELKRVSPTTKIYIIGYPQFIADTTITKVFCTEFSLDYQEVDIIRDSVTRINNVLKMVAHDQGVYYVDIEDSLDGGQICQGSKYMTGLIKVIGKAAFGYTQEAYHPNASGHQRIADVIEDRIINNNLTYEIIDIPIPEGGHRTYRAAVTNDYAGPGSTQSVVMSESGFKDGEYVGADMFSKKIHLGDTKVMENGKIEMRITIPWYIEPGVHLLTLTGENNEGDTIQVQQFIAIESSDNIDDLPTTHKKDNTFTGSVANSSIYAKPPSIADNSNILGYKNINSDNQESLLRSGVDKKDVKNKINNTYTYQIATAMCILLIGTFYVTKKIK